MSEVESHFEHKLSLAIIIKDETYYIKEWIEYHRIVGVDHFYIYDNESSDNILELLSQYIDNGIVTYKYWGGQVVQLSAYNDAIKNYRQTTKYLGFIDTDEFIIPVKGGTLPEVLDEIFNENPECGAVGVNWRIYGSNKHEIRPEGSVLENYKYRAKDDYSENIHVKSICNPRVISGFYANPHQVDCIDNYKCFSDTGESFSGPFFYGKSGQRLRINHYHLKSKDDYYIKRRRGWPDHIDNYPGDKKIEEDFKLKDVNYNEIYDDIVDKYIDELRKRGAI